MKKKMRMKNKVFENELFFTLFISNSKKLRSGDASVTLRDVSEIRSRRNDLNCLILTTIDKRKC